jgi:hypothetical protein
MMEIEHIDRKKEKKLSRRKYGKRKSKKKKVFNQGNKEQKRRE